MSGTGNTLPCTGGDGALKGNRYPGTAPELPEHAGAASALLQTNCDESINGGLPAEFAAAVSACFSPSRDGKDPLWFGIFAAGVLFGGLRVLRHLSNLRLPLPKVGLEALISLKPLPKKPQTSAPFASSGVSCACVCPC